MQIVMWIIVIAAGCISAILAGANSTLNTGMRQPALSAMVANSTGLIFIVMVLLILWLKQGAPTTRLSDLRQLPWWAWIGGSLGAIYLLVAVSFAERLGSGLFAGLSVTAAIITSVLLDHFALVGFKQHPAHVGRIMGCSLMIAGLTLVAKF